MLTLRRFKETVLLVGFLIIGLGTYAGFQANDAHGHGSWDHDYKWDVERVKQSSTSSTKKETCTLCNKQKRNRTKTITKYRQYRVLIHLHRTA